MENLIKYYYNIENINIIKVKDYFYFEIDSIYYYFLPFTRSLTELKDIGEIIKLLKEKNLLIHEIIPNNNDDILSEYKNTPYILIKTFINKNNAFDINDILYLNNSLPAKRYKNNKISREKWNSFFETKIDYFEYQFSQVEKKYPIIKNSFGYYVGLAENSISYYKQINTSNIKDELVVSRRKIKLDSTAFDIYNPLNFVLDVKMRDISEYLKYCFYNNLNWKQEFYILLNMNYISKVDAHLLYSRLLYPSFYFDLYEEIIYGITNEEKILNIVNRYMEYEEFLKIIFNELNKLYNLPQLGWI